MKNFDDYEDWFGIPLNEIKSETSEQDNKNNNDSSSDKNKQSEIENKKPKKEFHCQNHHIKSLINKKRNPSNQIGSNINKNNIDNKIYQEDKNDINRINKQNNSNIYNDYINNDIFEKSLVNRKEKNKYLVYEEQIKTGIVKFNGLKNKFDQNDKRLKHCIFLKTYNDFNSEVENKKYSWTVKLLCDSKFIGIGLADKYIVIKNNFKFFSNKKSFYNGVFCLYSIYDSEIKKNKIYAWHPGNTNLNDNEITFPPFQKGMIISLTYETKSYKLEFSANDGNKNVSFTIDKVNTLGGFGRNILTPCIIFFYPNDQVQISKLISL